MNTVKRIYLMFNLAVLWIAAVLVMDAIGMRELSPLYGAVIMAAIIISSFTAFQLAVRQK